MTRLITLAMLNGCASRDWRQIRSAWSCYTCDSYATADDHSLDPPEGWRQSRRGYYGIAYFCPDCVREDRKYQRDYTQRLRGGRR